jgi:hypothetical protein
MRVIKISIKIHHHPQDSSLKNNHCACHQKYLSLEIAIVLSIAFGIENFHYFEHKYQVQQFHGTKKLGF